MQAYAYSHAILEQVDALAQRHPRGWIVDLRPFSGDDMWPAIGGLAPLIGYGTIGGFRHRDATQAWQLAPGRASIAGRPANELGDVGERPAFVGPVAVLVGPGTMSAGETTALTFRGRPNTRLFGAPTAGYTSTGIQAHALSDGSQFGIASYAVVDRDGAGIDGGLGPDEPARSDAQTLAAAAAWIARVAPRSKP